jgi:hypothetical protein
VDESDLLLITQKHRTHKVVGFLALEDSRQTLQGHVSQKLRSYGTPGFGNNVTFFMAWQRRG